MNDYLAADVSYTSSAIDAMLKAYPELMDDEELRSDMLEAETSLPAVASKIVRARQERLAMAEGLNLYIKDLTERRDRLARGADGLKGLLLKLMSTAKLPTLPLPEATVSVRAGNTSVSITDIDALPQGFFTVETKRVPRKDALKVALEAGADVPGAALVTGENVLTVRVK
jgi:hypothetical protein